jgi:hypothetical protein
MTAPPCRARSSVLRLRLAPPPGLPLALAVSLVLVLSGCDGGGSEEGPRAEPRGATEGVVTIQDSCGESWAITTSMELRIGGIDDPGQFVQAPGGVTRDGQGRVWISFPSEALYLYDADGSFLTQVGREGEGPGEYRSIRNVVVAPGDTVHVLDRGNRRATVLSPELEVLSTIPLEVPPWGGALRLDSGDWILNSMVTGEGSVGFPLHHLDPSGRLLESFGALTPEWDPAFQLGLARSLAGAPDGGVWSAHRTQYRLELWDMENRLHRTLVRRVNWFEPQTGPGQREPRDPQPPVLSSIHLDPSGVLWTRSFVARDNYDEFLEEVAPGRWFPRDPAGDAFRVVVEAIDPERACVLARHETGAYFLRIIEDGWFSGYRESPEGIPYVELHRIELVRR